MTALDARTGEVRWRRIAEGRVEIAPCWWQGKLYFSDDAGWAWCLRARDGEVVWRFRAALGTDTVTTDGRIISAWPVGSGVLVHEGVAYFACGFCPDEPGRLHAVDAVTGKVLWTKGRQGRFGLRCPRGAIAVGDKALFVPTVGGPPVVVSLTGKDHGFMNLKLWGGAMSARGRWLMTIGDDVIAASPTLEYTHHVASYYDHKRLLPVVTDDAIYVRDGRALTADRRSAYKVHKKGGEFTHVESSDQGKVRKSPNPADQLWKVDSHPRLTAVIMAGGLLFAGSHENVTAYDAGTGAEKWSAKVNGEVRDLAVLDGCLLVVTDAGEIACFGRDGER